MRLLEIAAHFGLVDNLRKQKYDQRSLQCVPPIHWVLLYALPVIFSACSKAPKERDMPNLPVDPQAIETVERATKFEDIFVLEKQIQLENSEGAMIGDVSKLYVGPEEQFFIADETMRRALIFDNTGKLQSTLTYDDILGPGKKNTRLRKVVFLSDHELVLAFINDGRLYFAELTQALQLRKVLVGERVSNILDLCRMQKRQILCLVGRAGKPSEFRLIAHNGKVINEFNEVSSKMFPNLMTKFSFNLHSLTADMNGFAYYTNGFEPKIYKYAISTHSYQVFVRNSPAFEGPSRDSPTMYLQRGDPEEFVKGAIIKHILLDNGLILLIYSINGKPKYDFVDINGNWHGNPMHLSPGDGLNVLIAVAFGDHIYSFSMPEPDKLGNFGNPKILKFGFAGGG